MALRTSPGPFFVGNHQQSRGRFSRISGVHRHAGRTRRRLLSARYGRLMPGHTSMRPAECLHDIVIGQQGDDVGADRRCARPEASPLPSAPARSSAIAELHPPSVHPATRRPCQVATGRPDEVPHLPVEEGAERRVLPSCAQLVDAS